MLKNPAGAWEPFQSTSAFHLIAGPCVIESEALCREVASHLAPICQSLGIHFIFKASYDKANRTSGKSFRGPGIRKGLATLKKIGREFSLPILTDVHDAEQVMIAGESVDVLQIPAFLCRQTDLLHAAVKTGRIVNVKKGQFLSPTEMSQVVEKVRGFGGQKLILTERGTTFGYNNLVVDMRSFPILSEFGCPVIFDATHSVQQPGGGGTHTSGQRQFVPTLAKAAVAAGVNGLFIETHPDPDRALSDGPNMVPLHEMERLLRTVMAIRLAVHSTSRPNPVGSKT